MADYAKREERPDEIYKAKSSSSRGVPQKRLSPYEQMAIRNWRNFTPEGRRQVHNERFHGAAWYGGPGTEAHHTNGLPLEDLAEDADQDRDAFQEGTEDLDKLGGAKGGLSFENSPAPESMLTYTIKQGDTFWGLAQKSSGKITVQNLREWNPEANPLKLQIGSKIRISPNFDSEKATAPKQNLMKPDPTILALPNDHVALSDQVSNLPTLVTLPAWEIRNEWNDAFIQMYGEFVLRKAKDDNLSGEKFTCEDFALDGILDFARINALPFIFKNGTGIYDASASNWTSFNQFKSILMETTAAGDLSNPAFANAVEKDIANVTPGDLILCFQGKPEAHHVSLITGVSDEEISGYQGNFRVGGYDEHQRARKKPLTSTQPFFTPGDEKYLGSEVFPWKIDQIHETYTSIKIDGQKSKTVPFSLYVAENSPHLFQFNFYSWNK